MSCESLICDHLILERASISLIDVHQPGEDPPELAPDGLETGQGLGAFLVRRVGDAKLPIEGVDRDFLVDGETLEAEKPDQIATVGEFLVVGDEADAADHRGPAAAPGSNLSCSAAYSIMPMTR